MKRLILYTLALTASVVFLSRAQLTSQSMQARTPAASQFQTHAK